MEKGGVRVHPDELVLAALALALVVKISDPGIPDHGVEPDVGSIRRPGAGFIEGHDVELVVDSVVDLDNKFVAIGLVEAMVAVLLAGGGCRFHDVAPFEMK